MYAQTALWGSAGLSPTSTNTVANTHREKGIDFSFAWDLYDYKVGRHAAEKMWKRLTYEEQQMAIGAIPRYVEATFKDGRFPSRAHFSTWLNQRRFEDEEAPVAPVAEDAASPAISYYDMLKSGIPTSMYEAVPQPNGRKPLWRLKQR